MCAGAIQVNRAYFDKKLQTAKVIMAEQGPIDSFSARKRPSSKNSHV